MTARLAHPPAPQDQPSSHETTPPGVTTSAERDADSSQQNPVGARTFAGSGAREGLDDSCGCSAFAAVTREATERAEIAELRAKVARVEALCDMTETRVSRVLMTDQVRAALAGDR